VNQQAIFRDRDDFIHFLYLAGRYLSSYHARNRFGRPYPNYYDSLELLCYCLWPDYFHFLVYQEEAGALAKFMASLLTSYSRYFNIKYQRTGPVFETRYKATQVTDHRHLRHLTRYIHLKPDNWENYRFSSLQYYFSDIRSASVRPTKVEAQFSSKETYLAFLNDTQGYRAALKEIQDKLADN
jgi:hypothetical protein